MGLDLPPRLAVWRRQAARYAAATLAVILLLTGAAWLVHRSGAARTEAQAHQRQEAERRHAAEAALREARALEALGRMARGVAHDVNNLLTVVIGNLENIEDQAAEPTLRGMAQRGRDAAEGGAALMASLLAYARTQMLRIEAVELAPMLREMQPMMRDLAGPGITVELDIDRDLPRCRVDVAQLRAALCNLVSNARDAIADHGRITLTTRRVPAHSPELQQEWEVMPGDCVALSVADTGCGMTAEVAAQVFEPFFTTKPVGRGSGLGLSQVYGLLRQLGGHAALGSAPGMGSVVTLYLPVVPAQDLPPPAPAPTPTPTPTPAPAPAPAPEGPKRVLVVEDQPDILKLTENMLRRAGYMVSTASGSAAALALLEQDEGFDLVLSDVLLPNGIGGVELVRRIRALQPGIAAVLMSGYAPDSQAIQTAGVGYLAKPFTRQALLRAVTTALQG